jgi:hypothetical protein
MADVAMDVDGGKPAVAPAAEAVPEPPADVQTLVRLGLGPADVPAGR